MGMGLCPSSEWHHHHGQVAHGSCVHGRIHQKRFQDKTGVIAGYLSETRSVFRSRSKAIRIQMRLSMSQAETKKFSMAGVEY